MRSRTAAITAILVLCCAACAAPGTGQPTLLLGALYPLSGPQAAGGTEELAGVRTAIALINADGGVAGRRVDLQVRDVPAPEGAAEAVASLSRAGVPLILGSYSSVIAVTASAEAARRGVVWWETGAVGDDLTAHHRPYVFRTVAAGSTLGRTSARFTADVLAPAWKVEPAALRIVVAYEGDAYGRSVAEGARAEAAAHGLTVVDAIPYDAGNFDPGALAARVAADRPDVLWDASYLGDGIALWRALAGAGLRLRAAIGTSSAFCMPEFGRQLGPLATGVYASDKPDGAVNPAALSPTARALLHRAQVRYRQQTHRDMGIAAVAGFVGAWSLLHDVLPHAAALTPDGIRAAALAADVPAGSEINGAGLRFAPADAPDAGQNRRAASVVGQWQAGAMRVVYPAAFREAEPQLIPVPSPLPPAR